MTPPTTVGDHPIAETNATGPNLGPAVTGLEQQLGVMFAKARSLVRSRAAQVHPDLPPAGYSALAVLVRSGPQHAQSLASTLLLDKSSMSRLIKQLGKLGLVERRSDPEDGRAYFVAATGEAVEKVSAIRDDWRRRLHEFLADWDVADIEQLTGLLERLNVD